MTSALVTLVLVPEAIVSTSKSPKKKLMISMVAKLGGRVVSLETRDTCVKLLTVGGRQPRGSHGSLRPQS